MIGLEQWHLVPNLCQNIVQNINEYSEYSSRIVTSDAPLAEFKGCNYLNLETVLQLPAQNCDGASVLKTFLSDTDKKVNTENTMVAKPWMSTYFAYSPYKNIFNCTYATLCDMLQK